MMDVEGVNPEGLRDDRFKDFWDAEKAAVDQVSAPVCPGVLMRYCYHNVATHSSVLMRRC